MNSPNTFFTGPASTPGRPSDAAMTVISSLTKELHTITTLEQATSAKPAGKESALDAFTTAKALYETLIKLCKAPNPMLKLSSSEAIAFASKLVSAVLTDPTGITATATIADLVKKSLEEGPKPQQRPTPAA